MKKQISILCMLLLLGGTFVVQGQSDLHSMIDSKADRLEQQVIEWRRHFHEYPELSNREFETAEKVAQHLSDLGLNVKTGVAHTGVVGILETGRPGPTIGLRADMDALPVVERVDFRFCR